MGTMWDCQPTLLPLETRTKLLLGSVITSGKGSAVDLADRGQEPQGPQFPLALPTWHTYSSVALAAAQKYRLGLWIPLSLQRRCLNFTRPGSTGLWTKLRQQSVVTLLLGTEQNKEHNMCKEDVLISSLPCPLSVLPLGPYSYSWEITKQTITPHNLLTPLLCLTLWAPSSPLAAKGIQQSSHSFKRYALSFLHDSHERSMPDFSGSGYQTRLSTLLCLSLLWISSMTNRMLPASCIFLSLPCILKEKVNFIY